MMVPETNPSPVRGLRKVEAREHDEGRTLQLLLLCRPGDEGGAIVDELEGAGFCVAARHATTRRAFTSAFGSEVDAIVVFVGAGPEAGSVGWTLLREYDFDVPCLVVADTFDRDVVTRAFRMGVDDVLVRGELARLGPAMAHALEQRRLRLDRRRAYLALQRSEMLNRAVLRSLAGHVIVLDRFGRVLAINEGVQGTFDSDSRLCDAAEGDDYLASCRRRTDAGAAVAARAADGVAAVLSGQRSLYAVEYPAADGRRWYSMQATPLHAEGGVVMLHQDVTERKAAERKLRALNEEIRRVNDELTAAVTSAEQANSRLKENQALLVQSEKMASLGQLSAGIAHEINNPVGYVESNLHRIGEYAEAFEALFEAYSRFGDAVVAGDADASVQALRRVKAIRKQEDVAFLLEDLHSIVAESVSGMHHVKEITDSLKRFARVDEVEMQETDLNECIEAALRIVWNELKYTCEVRKDLGTLPLIQSHPGQLNQVIMNLLMNAAQAVDERGEIFIQTEADGRHVVLRIRDNGVGIEASHLPQLFNPFFTTKPVGQGTGLGLSISYGIIQRHGGSIDVESRLGEGTTFVIRLPITPEAATVGEQQAPAGDGTYEDPANTDTDGTATPAWQRLGTEESAGSADTPEGQDARATAAAVPASHTPPAPGEGVDVDEDTRRFHTPRRRIDE